MKAGMPANMILGPLAIRRKLQALLQTQLMYTTQRVDGGFELLSYQGAQYYPSSNMSIDQNYNGTCEGEETGGSSGSLYFINNMDVQICTLGGNYFKTSKPNICETIFDGLDFYTWLVLFVKDPTHLCKYLGIGPL